MQKDRLYLDSSVWNAAFDARAPELMAATNDFLTRAESAGATSCYLSDVVLDELANAPVPRVTQLGALIARINPVQLTLDSQAANLADAYVRHGILTSGHLADARHVAVATVAELDVLVSWNYRHLVNRRRREAFNGVNAIMGYRAIEIISPPEVFDVE